MITAVADRYPQRIAHLVYLDAIVPRRGESWSSFHDESTRQAGRAGITRDGAMPPLPASAFGLTGEDAAWVDRRQRPYPGGVYEDALHFDEARMASLPRTFVDCTTPALPTVNKSRVRVRSEPGWRVIEIATGNYKESQGRPQNTALIRFAESELLGPRTLSSHLARRTPPTS